MLNIKTSYVFPVWFMRQSGRYLPEYQKIRKKYPFLEILKNPELITKLTLLPLKYFKPDFLIIFSDISIVFSLIENADYTIVDSHGPVVKINDFNNIKIKTTSPILESIKESIKILKKEQSLPLIGFIGGIYTTLFYLIKHSKINKNLIYSNENILFIINELIYKVAEAQIESGLDLIQIFDTYLFDLSPLEIEFYILPFYKVLLNKIKLTYPHVFIIFFALNTFHIIEYVKDLKIDCLSVDWKKDLDIYFDNFRGYIQGNLDPFILTIQDWQEFKKILNLSLIRIFKAVENENIKRYIFNVGHGLLPNTRIENIQYLLDKLQKN